MGGVPSTRNRPSFQRLQAVGAVPHHQVAISELPWFYSRVVPAFNSSLHCFSLQPCFLPDFIQQIQIHSPFFIRIFSHKILKPRRTFLDFNWNHYITPIYQTKRGFMGSRLLSGMICPYYAGNFLSPRPLGLLQPPLQASQQNPIG